MSISLIKQPATYHSSHNVNYWAFQSDMRFASRFNLRAIIKDGSNIYNTVLLPTAPNNYNLLDAKNIMRDFVKPDFNPKITTPTKNDSYKSYNISLEETFEGLYIQVSAVGGSFTTASVINNYTLQGIITPSSIRDIEFVNGPVTSFPVWAIGYTTASNGFINQLTLSTDRTAISPVTASVGNSYGYLVFNDYTIYSIGASYSTLNKKAFMANIDYLDYFESDNFTSYKLGTGSNLFLTNAPNTQYVQKDEWGTLTFIQDDVYTMAYAKIITDTGLTLTQSCTASSLNGVLKIDIPTGPKNLNLPTNVNSYTVQMFRIAGAEVVASEKRTFKLHCLKSFGKSLRLCWLNRLGGIDYYTFRFLEQAGDRVQRSNFDKNLSYGSTKEDRGISTYKLDYYGEYTVVSDLLDDETSEWLSELFTSTDVYLMRYDAGFTQGDLLPITLTGDQYLWNVGFDNKEARINFRLSRTNYK